MKTAPSSRRLDILNGALAKRCGQRGSNEFENLAHYPGWLEGVADKINPRNRARIDEERPHLQPLPAAQAADYTELWVRVTSSSTIHVRLRVYTVPARLIGERLRVHLYDDRLECYLGTTPVLTLPRIYAPKGKRRARSIDYRHVIGSLVKKPRAFYHSPLRDDLLPSDAYRRIWQGLASRLDPRAACKLMIGVLALAAEYHCEEVLGEYLLQALKRDTLPTLMELQRRFGRPADAIPLHQVQQHRLQGYDQLWPALNDWRVSAEVVHG